AVMHLARFLREFPPDVFGVLCQMIADFAQLLPQFALLRRQHRNGRCRGSCFRGRGLRRLFPALSGRAEIWRHDRFRDFGRGAAWTGYQLALGLLLVTGAVGKTALECVALLADKRVADHDWPRTMRKCAASAAGASTSKRRPCCSEGIFARAAATSAGSISVMITPGSVSPSARMRPHGSTMSEWPSVERGRSCWPARAARETDHDV